jgi:hypothetical protein
MLKEEASLRFFNTRGAETRVDIRNPITQEGIRDKELNEPSKGNPRGPGRSIYSGMNKGSFKFSYRNNEAEQPAPKPVRDFHNGRNPITQESVQMTDRPSVNRSQFDKYYKSNIFEVSKQELASPLKNRSNQKFHSSKVFEGEEPNYRPLCKKKEIRNSEVAGLMNHHDRSVHDITQKPNSNRITSSDIVQSRKEANEMVKVLHARRNNSSITFS